MGEYRRRELSRDQSLFSPITGMELEIPYPLVALTIAYVMQCSDDGHVLVFLPGWTRSRPSRTSCSTLPAGTRCWA